MSLSALSLFDTGLVIMIIAILVLYLIVLIKLKPSNEGKEILEKNLSNNNISKGFSTERRSNPQTYNEPQKESVEKAELTRGTEPVKRPEPASPPNKTGFLKETRKSGCPHHFRYLGEHPKNTPIPNECLTCVKIMECLEGAE
jgi:hypothetical protein